MAAEFLLRSNALRARIQFLEAAIDNLRLTGEVCFAELKREGNGEADALRCASERVLHAREAELARLRALLDQA